MWSKPWSYKEGLVIGAGLLVIGLLLQMTVGAIHWDLFACPVNVIVLVVYIIALVAMHLLRKRVYLFGWLSHYSAAVSSLLWVVGMTVVMGLIRQAPSGHAPADLLGFSQMISSWPFVLLYFWMGHRLGADNPSHRFLFEDQQDFFPTESYRIVYCTDNSHFGKCRYAKVENDNPDGKCRMAGYG